MSLFEKVQREHIEGAIRQLDEKGLAEYPDSKYYDVLDQKSNKRYPPKPVMAIAEELATGNSVKTTDFSGGESTPAFKKLKELGFTIVGKTTDHIVFDELKEFLDQAQTENLKVRDYIDSYRGLKVKVSFGQGVPARIPWISFLGKDQTTSKGIYPVYLFYKSEDLLILAYGVSETNEPQIDWALNSGETIEDYFKSLNKKPDRYGNSYIYKVYDINNQLSPDAVQHDLDNIIDFYFERLEQPTRAPNLERVKFDYSSFTAALREAGYIFSEIMVTRFVSALCTKPFVILTGLSGSGKTKLAQSFVQWICQDDSQYQVVPVGADWTNREPLLGYPNALTDNEYVQPDSGVLKLITNAIERNELPYFLILDEMNLSHVERYFADFLSVMESGESIMLHSMDKCSNPPENLKIPNNLFIIGTVNIDETTYMFSPKVLDRANTIEFRISEEEMQAFLESDKKQDLASIRSKGAKMAFDFLTLTGEKTKDSSVDISPILLSFFKELKKVGAEFGYRTGNEILTLLNRLEKTESSLSLNQRLDIAIVQKLLPKVHGSRRKLDPILTSLGVLCLTEALNLEDFKKTYLSNENNSRDLNNIRFPLTLDKIQRMYQSAIDHGFASFAEA